MVKIKYIAPTCPSLDSEDVGLVREYESMLLYQKTKVAEILAGRIGPAPILSTDVKSTYETKCKICGVEFTVTYSQKSGVNAVIRVLKVYGWHHRVIRKAKYRWMNDEIECYCAKCANEAKFSHILL